MHVNTGAGYAFVQQCDHISDGACALDNTAKDFVTGMSYPYPPGYLQAIEFGGKLLHQSNRATYPNDPRQSATEACACPANDTKHPVSVQASESPGNGSRADPEFLRPLPIGRGRIALNATHKISINGI